MKTFALWVCSSLAIFFAAPLIESAQTSSVALAGAGLAVLGVAGIMATLVRIQR